MSNDEGRFEDVIQAGGGLVWRDSPGGSARELAVIRRSRYEGEGWTLPKGKLDSKRDTTWQGAAKREVAEETGCEVEVTTFAGCTSYVDKKRDKPKVVLYWNMNVVNQAISPEDTGEVKEVRWMTPQEALSKLHYPGERAVLSANLET